MSKISYNKIISIIFFIIFIALISLSIFKIQSSEPLEQKQEAQETLGSSDIEKEIVEKQTVDGVDDIVAVNDTEVQFSFNIMINEENISYSFDGENNLFDVMKEMRDKGKIKFEAKDFSGLGAYIYSINDISEDRKEGMYWIYYINDEKATVGVSNYILKGGDQIKWQLENNIY